MKECEYLSSCSLPGTENLRNIYIEKYCKGLLKNNCIIRFLKINGKNIAATLLPNGNHFERRIYDRRKMKKKTSGNLVSFFSDRRVFVRRVTD